MKNIECDTFLKNNPKQLKKSEFYVNKFLPEKYP